MANDVVGLKEALKPFPNMPFKEAVRVHRGEHRDWSIIIWHSSIACFEYRGHYGFLQNERIYSSLQAVVYRSRDRFG